MSRDLEEENCIKITISAACVAFRFLNENIEVLLCKGTDNSACYWSLPTSSLKKRENLDYTARRLVTEFGEHDNIYVEQVKTFGILDRTIFEHGITVGYLAIFDHNYFPKTALEAGKVVQWFKIKDLPELKLEHKEIMKCCMQHLKEIVMLKPIVFNLLPHSFTFPELMNIYEELLNIKLEKSNFRNKILKLKILNELKEKRKGGSRRMVLQYTFNPVAYKKIQLRS